jgi:uncharacterized protein
MDLERLSSELDPDDFLKALQDYHQQIMIAGCSVRAAAESAIRSGFTPWCCDRFGDCDLTKACTTRIVHDYPRAIPEMLASGPKYAGWMYTGGLENHPEVIAFVDRDLHGCSVESVRLVRHPRRLFEALSERGFPVARCDPPAGVRALVKPRCGGGGIGIRFHDGKPFDRGRFYTQEWLQGEPTSLVFLVGRHNKWCVGGSRQIVGADWLHCPEPFGYCGSICAIPEHKTELGVALQQVFGLRGLVGVDGIELDGVFRIVEVNPRYTASVEILERASGRSLLRQHFEFINHQSYPIDSRCGAAFTGHPGKAILYAPVDFTFPAAGPWDDDYPFADLRRRFADLPHPGQEIRLGQPVLTFFADGDSPLSTEAALRKIAGDLDRLLFGR